MCLSTFFMTHAASFLCTLATDTQFNIIAILEWKDTDHV